MRVRNTPTTSHSHVLWKTTTTLIGPLGPFHPAPPRHVGGGQRPLFAGVGRASERGQTHADPAPGARVPEPSVVS